MTFFKKNNPIWQQAKAYNLAGSKIKPLTERYFLNLIAEWARS